MASLAGRWTPMVLVPVLLLALAGCSGDDDEGDADQAAGTPSGTASTSAATASPQLPAAPELVDATGGTDDVDWDASSCPTTAGSVSTSGKVTNPTKKGADYVITISWLDDGSATLARGVALVKRAKPGAETAWKLKATVPDGASACVMNVLRGSIAK